MSDTEAKYEALRALLVAAGTQAPTDLPAVLAAVCRAVGLAGCAVAGDPQANEPVVTAGEVWAEEALREYAGALWHQLVVNHHAESAFIQLAPEGRPLSLFAYPVRAQERIVGTVLGLAEGRRNLATEDDFLLALATALYIARVAGAPEGPPGAGREGEASNDLEKARQAAILETAIAVNHEVNNPLTAVLGNTQLLLLQSEGLDARTRKRLQDIERSALRIKEVTQKLLKKGPFRSTDYPGGSRMLDLSDSEAPPDADGV